jgi:hypothetical protein
MNTRRNITLAFLVACFFTLALPAATASAQGRYDPYGNDDDRTSGNERRREQRRNDRGRYEDDRYEDGRYGTNRNGYDTRYVREAARRIESRSDDFRDAFDDALDNSRYDDTRREDRLVGVANDFEKAADRFKNRIGNGRNIQNSRNEAQQLLEIGTRIDRFMNRNRLNSRTVSLWSQIRQDLRVISDAYGYRTGGIYDEGDYRQYPQQRRGNSRSNVGTILGDIFGNRY